MVKCGPAWMQACSFGLVWLGFRVRDKVRVSVRDRVGVRVSHGVRISTFLARDVTNIYISRLCYDVSVRLSVRLSICL